MFSDKVLIFLPPKSGKFTERTVCVRFFAKRFIKLWTIYFSITVPITDAENARTAKFTIRPMPDHRKSIPIRFFQTAAVINSRSIFPTTSRILFSALRRLTCGREHPADVPSGISVQIQSLLRKTAGRRKVALYMKTALLTVSP